MSQLETRSQLFLTPSTARLSFCLKTRDHKSVGLNSNKNNRSRLSGETARGIAMTTAVALTSLILFFQNCAPATTPSSDDLASAVENGDSSYRLPANFNETLNTGVTCSVAASAATIPIGGSLTFTVSTTGTVPAGFQVYTFGSKNGVADSSEVVPYFESSLVQTSTNPGYVGGNYIRYFQVRDNLGRTLCQTNSVAVTLQGRSCTLSISASTVRQGNPVVFTTAYGAGTVIPVGATVRFEGQNNGVDITPIPYDSTNYASYSRTMGTIDIGNTYIRRIVILNPDSSVYCQTNNVRISVIR